MGVGKVCLYLYITLFSLNVYHNHFSLKRGLDGNDLKPLLWLIPDRTCAPWIRHGLCFHWRTQTLPSLPSLQPTHLPGLHFLLLVLSQVCLSAHPKIECLLVPLGAWCLGAPFCTSVFKHHILPELRLSVGSHLVLLTFLSSGHVHI